MLTEKVIFLINLISFGLTCLLFPKFSVKIVESFVRLTSKLMTREFDKEHVKVRVAYIRLMGLASLLVGLLVFIGG